MTKIPKPDSWSAHFDLTYDAWNRLVQVADSSGTVATYEYDGLGQRIVKDIPGGSTDDRDYYYNDQWQLLTEVKNGTDKSLYHWHPFYIDALAVRMRAGETYFFLQDANFNVTAAVDDSDNAVDERYAYSPYGEVTFLDPSFSSISASTIGNTHLYTGRERDPETGLQLNRHRFYSSWLGRWMSQDPIEYGAGANLYLYANATPATAIDPSGEYFVGEPTPPGGWMRWPPNPPGKAPKPMGRLGCIGRVLKKVQPTFGKGDSDKYKHCVVSCHIMRDCSIIEAAIAGWGKEIIDIMGPGDADWGDLGADEKGWFCDDKTSCEQQCRKHYP